MTIATDVASLVGVSSPTCKRIADSAYKRYKIFYIPKRNSTVLRKVAQPSREVKSIQRALVAVLTPLLPVHEAATAYKKGSSILKNATQHVAARFITKLDFSNFFPSIDGATVARHLRASIRGIADSDVSFILAACLWRGDGSHALCIGAPSSPLLSNSVMFDFDAMITDFARRSMAVYTRYSDDITISSGHPDVLSSVELFLRAKCHEIEHPRLVINEAKRVAVGRGSGMYVTGLTLANQRTVTVGRLRKRGVRAGVQKFLSRPLSFDEIERLKGELAFVLSVEPAFRDVLIRTYGDAMHALLSDRGQE